MSVTESGHFLLKNLNPIKTKADELRTRDVQVMVSIQAAPTLRKVGPICSFAKTPGGLWIDFLHGLHTGTSTGPFVCYL